MNCDFEARALKPHLRFNIGDVVFLNSDTARLCPLTVSRYVLFEDETDYLVQWVNSFGGLGNDSFADQALTQ